MLSTIKSYFLLAVAVGALVGLGWLMIHERSVEHAKDAAADARVAAAAQIHNVEVQSRAQILAAQMVADYKAAHVAPVLDSPRVLRCVAAPSGSGLSGHAGAASGGNGTPAVPAESTVPFDPSRSLLEDGRDADAQVTLLQGLIRSYQEAGVVAKK